MKQLDSLLGDWSSSPINLLAWYRSSVFSHFLSSGAWRDKRTSLPVTHCSYRRPVCLTESPKPSSSPVAMWVDVSLWRSAASRYFKAFHLIVEQNVPWPSNTSNQRWPAVKLSLCTRSKLPFSTTSTLRVKHFVLKGLLQVIAANTSGRISETAQKRKIIRWICHFNCIHKSMQSENQR